MNLLTVLQGGDSWQSCSIPVEGTPRPWHTVLVTSRLAAGLSLPSCRMGPSPPQLQRAAGLSCPSPHRGHGAAVTAAFVEGQEEDGAFQAPSLVVATNFGAGRRRKFAGAGTQSKLCVLHTWVALSVLQREELWVPCLSPRGGFGDEACALESVLQQSRAVQGAACWVRPQQPVLPSRWAAVFSIKCSF